MEAREDNRVPRSRDITTGPAQALMRVQALGALVTIPLQLPLFTLRCRALDSFARDAFAGSASLAASPASASARTAAFSTLRRDLSLIGAPLALYHIVAESGDPWVLWSGALPMAVSAIAHQLLSRVFGRVRDSLSNWVATRARRAALAATAARATGKRKKK